MEAEDNADPTVIMSSTIYHLHLAPFSLMKCQSEKCDLKRRFAWRGRGDCNSTLVCTTLEGNVCGDYAVVDDDGRELCHEGISQPLLRVDNLDRSSNSFVLKERNAGGLCSLERCIRCLLGQAVWICHCTQSATSGALEAASRLRSRARRTRT